ncbi:hypothetical protein [Streptomyces sp. NBC_00859]|uniref:hypothetical protein n=1 Tax=Streptomyces sp. NBC_00859 TaxID=2903682 RepID=UPI00386D0E3B|nr:hypothetical protein OG584_19880 [Streptomyces sp. NBC_00859]
MTQSEPKVPNPRKADLVRLRSDLAKQVDAFRAALKKPTADVGGDKVWVGKNARAWHMELNGRHKRLVGQVEKLLPVVDAAIKGQPDKVPAAEARMYNHPTFQA